MKDRLLKIIRSKLFIYAAAAAVTAIIAGMLYSHFSKKNAGVSTTANPTPVQEVPVVADNSQSTSDFGEATDENKIVNVVGELKDSSSKEKSALSSKLPIYIRDFETSSGIKTTINVFSIEEDAPDYIRVEIYRINYNNTDAGDINPDYVAFKESFSKAKEEIKKSGADPEKLIYIFYTREYIHEVAEGWARTAGLIKY